MRSVNQKECKCGCGKEKDLHDFPKEVFIISEDTSSIISLEKAQCHNCGKLIMGKEICVYHRKSYCANCCARVRRRGV